MANFLEQLVAEWYEFNGFFVRRNVKVGRRANGGYDGELDIVAFHPLKKCLIHIEPSMDADPWHERERRFTKKFSAGRDHIPELFSGFEPLPEIEQIALFGFGSTKEHATVGGGRVVLLGDFMRQIRDGLKGKNYAKAAVPEGYPTIRALQLAANFWTS
jgi:hypothetical protein